MARNQIGHTLCAFALALSSWVVACSEPQSPRDRARLPVLKASGEHAAHTQAPARQIELQLKSGFGVRLRLPAAASQLAPSSLEVAAPPVTTQAIDAAFVPIGPTVALRSSEARIEASFLAEAFHVRAGHRLVLAVEQAPPCAPSMKCDGWQLLPARYSGGHCRAELTGSTLRMQFGSLPSADSRPAGALTDSGAP